MGHRLQIDLSEEDYQKLRILAKAGERSISDVVRRALTREHYLETQERDGRFIYLGNGNGKDLSKLIML